MQTAVILIVFLFVGIFPDSLSCRQTYIVHVLKPNGKADYLSADDRLSHHLSFLPSPAELIYSYSDAINGFAARLSPEDVEAMKSKDGFLLAIPDSVVKHHTTYTPSFIGLNSNSGPWPGSNFGEGIIIGLIDTGIDPTHLSFSDFDEAMPPPPPKWGGSCGFSCPKACNNKLIGAITFLNGSHPTPMDDIGHGTHTSSTAAGAAVSAASVLGQALGVVATGVAPGAHLSMYRVLANGSGLTSDVIAGIDRAIRDNVDVLSMSLAESFPHPVYKDSISTSSFAAIRKGIVPCASAGNSGPGAGSISNDAPWLLTVGAATTDRRIAASLLLGDGNALIGESGYQLSKAIPFKRMVNPGGNANCTKSELAKVHVNDMILLCSYIVASVADLKNAGVAAIVLLGPKLSGLATFADVSVLPVLYLNYQNVEILLSYITASNDSALAAIEFNGTQFGAPNSPSVASFSSRGPSNFNGGILKPDVIGPGVNVMAAWPNGIGPNPASVPSNKNFNFLSGTSMSAPHISGVTAIIKKLHPNWSAAAVKSAIMTTAYATYADGSPIADQYPSDGPTASVFAIGAGHVDARKAAYPGLVYDAGVNDYVAYMCGLGYTDEQVSAVTQRAVKCASVKSIPAEQLNYPSVSLTLQVGSEKKKSVTRIVTNVGEAESVYQLKYNTPKEVELIVTPSELAFTKVGEKKSFVMEFSIGAGAKPRKGEVAEGDLRWVKGDVTVRSPFVVNFA